MINKPTLAEMLRSISHDLTVSIEPALNDESLVTKVQMMAALMDAIAIRTEREGDWRAEQIQAIVAVAADAVPRLGEGHPASKALEAISDHSPTDETYQQASELLSCLAEAAFETADAELQTKVEGLLNQRLAAEVAVIGENFEAIGRG